MSHQAPSPTPHSIKAVLARLSLAQISEGGAVALDIAFKAGRESVIIVRKGDVVSAFRNRCPHARWPLDTFDGRFLFTPEGDLMCAAHGAIFDPITGACRGGPGTGAGLTVVDIRQTDGGIEILES